jgi:hypothetical protein
MNFEGGKEYLNRTQHDSALSKSETETAQASKYRSVGPLTSSLDKTYDQPQTAVRPSCADRSSPSPEANVQDQKPLDWGSSAHLGKLHTHQWKHVSIYLCQFTTLSSFMFRITWRRCQNERKGKLTPAGKNFPIITSPPSGITRGKISAAGGNKRSPSSTTRLRYSSFESLVSVISSCVVKAPRISALRLS